METKINLVEFNVFRTVYGSRENAEVLAEGIDYWSARRMVKKGQNEVWAVESTSGVEVTTWA